jgi:IS4 transposase
MGAERIKERWGARWLCRNLDTHLIPTLSPLKSGEGE